MNDSVKFIFKTLIKVPVIIMISFLIFNIFAFSISYLKLASVSFIAMQVGIENNFIPNEEGKILENYMKEDISSDILRNVKFTDTTTKTKQQFGQEVTIGVQGSYNFILPLTPLEQSEGENNFDGLSGTSFKGFKSEQELEDKRNSRGLNLSMKIEYKVPGLHYYPDLDVRN